MNRWWIRALALLPGVLFAVAAMAAMLPTSKLVVQVLSVEQVSYHRDGPPLVQGRPVGDQVVETIGFVAKVQIVDVLRTDHGLVPGATIQIHYLTRRGTPRPIPITRPPLTPGDSVTIEVFGGGNGMYERH